MKAIAWMVLFVLPVGYIYPQQPNELQTSKIQIALKDYEIAQLKELQARTDIQTAQQKVLAQVAATKAELKLDETWDFDYSQGKFVKKQPVKAEPKKET